MNLKRRILYTLAHLMAFLPDTWTLRIQYLIRTGHILHLDKPKRFTEKLQHYKAYYRNPVMKQCVDKYAVRDYVAKALGTDKYLNTLYQLCERAEDIDFDALPNQFVIKTTDGGSGDNVLVCRDKRSLDIPSVVKTVSQWQSKNYPVISREWAYGSSSGSRIIVEKYLEESRNQDRSIDDYKFLCYDGQFRYLWIDKNRYSNHRRGFWSKELHFLDGYRSDCPTFETDPKQLPDNIGEMIKLAEQLAKGFPFVRVDLYNIDGQIIFGELTFYPWSGYVNYTPDRFDFELGEAFDVDSYGQYDRRKRLS